MPAIASLHAAGDTFSKPLPRQPDEGIGGWTGQGPRKGAGEAMGVLAPCGLRGAGHVSGRDALPNLFIASASASAVGADGYGMYVHIL